MLFSLILEIAYMSLTKTAITNVDGVGVFTRGYPDQLKEANQRDVDALTTFRSKKKWRAVENALKWRDDDIRVYFCPIGENEIHYTAVLDGLLINPEAGTDVAEEFLETDLEIHREHNDGLWEQWGGVNTLYRVSQFQKIEDPFSFTKLRKVSDGENIDPDYGYSYSLGGGMASGMVKWLTKPARIRSILTSAR